ncbi:MAG: hypothetical protein KIS79_15755 [Burkholderiales bacterium]|nr:hypothetical protein [Burkholderiales bacterium]
MRTNLTSAVALSLTASVAIPSVAYGATGVFDDCRARIECRRLNNLELNRLRGGFTFLTHGAPLHVSFGIAQAVVINDELVAVTQLTIPQLDNKVIASFSPISVDLSALAAALKSASSVLPGNEGGSSPGEAAAAQAALAAAGATAAVDPGSSASAAGASTTAAAQGSSSAGSAPGTSSTAASAPNASGNTRAAAANTTQASATPSAGSASSQPASAPPAAQTTAANGAGQTGSTSKSTSASSSASSKPASAPAAAVSSVHVNGQPVKPGTPVVNVPTAEELRGLIIQNGLGNIVVPNAADLSAAVPATLIQNTLNDQIISALTVINVSVSVQGALSASRIQESVRQSIANSLR